MEQNSQWFIGTDNLIKQKDKLTWFQMILLMKLNALSNYKGFAFCSNQYLADLFGLSKKHISKNIKELEELGYVKREYGAMSDRAITVLNFEYTLYSNMSIPLRKNEYPPILKNEYHNNKAINNKDNNKEEYKENKKESENLPDLYFENFEVNQIFLDFLDLRKSLKAVNSQKAIQTLINKLNKFDDLTKIKMLEESIMNSWKGVFEPKNQKSNRINEQDIYKALEDA